MDEQRVVLFEVCPTPQGRERYLELAAALRPLLEDFDGLVRMERFASLNQEGKLLSMNVWRDEASLERWRKAAEHRLCQQEGREQLFELPHHGLRPGAQLYGPPAGSGPGRLPGSPGRPRDPGSVILKKAAPPKGGAAFVFASLTPAPAAPGSGRCR